MFRPTKLSFQQPEVMDCADFGVDATCPVQRATFFHFDPLAKWVGIRRPTDYNMAGPALSNADVECDFDTSSVNIPREPSAAAQLILPEDTSVCNVLPVPNRDANIDVVEEGTDANDASFGVIDNVTLPLPATCVSFCPRELRVSPVFTSFDHVASATQCARPVARALSFNDADDDARVLNTNEYGYAAESVQTALERAPSRIAQLWVDENRSGIGRIPRRVRAIAAWGNAFFALPADYSTVTCPQPLPTAVQEKKRANNSWRDGRGARAANRTLMTPAPTADLGPFPFVSPYGDMWGTQVMPSMSLAPRLTAVAAVPPVTTVLPPTEPARDYDPATSCDDSPSEETLQQHTACLCQLSRRTLFAQVVVHNSQPVTVVKGGIVQMDMDAPLLLRGLMLMIQCLRRKALDDSSNVINVENGKRLLQVRQEAIVLMEFISDTRTSVTQAQLHSVFQCHWQNQRLFQQIRSVYKRTITGQAANRAQQQVVQKEDKEENGSEGGLAVADPTAVHGRTVAAENDAALEEGGLDEPVPPWTDIPQEGLASAGPTPFLTVLPLVGGFDVLTWPPDIMQEGLAVAGPIVTQNCHHAEADHFTMWPDISEEGLASAGPTHVTDGCSGYEKCFLIWPPITQEGPILAGLSGPEV